MTNTSERRTRLMLAAGAISAYCALLAIELATETDALRPLDIIADAVTLLLTVASTSFVALLALRVAKQQEERRLLVDDLVRARGEGETWRRKVTTHFGGLRAALDEQFGRWELTAAERDIGLLILKGLSLKEIATLRATSEATVRQQAQGVYRKSGLSGKAAFSSYFLEDLFVDDGPVARPSAPARHTDGGPASRH